MKYFSATELLEWAHHILNFGIIGLTFLFAFLAFILLLKEGRKKEPNPSMLKAVYVFMILSIVMGLGTGYFEFMMRNNQTPNTQRVGSLMDDFAHEAYTSGKKAAHLTGRWKAEWSVINEDGTIAPYPPDPEEVIQLSSQNGEIFCTSFDPSLECMYWLHGRLSDKDVVTLNYYSPTGDATSCLVGVVIMRVSQSVNGEITMDGDWIGWTRDQKITHGKVRWTKMEKGPNSA